MVRFDIALPTPVDIVTENFGLLVVALIVVAVAVIGLVYLKRARKKAK